MTEQCSQYTDLPILPVTMREVYNGLPDGCVPTHCHQHKKGGNVFHCGHPVEVLQ